MFDIPIATVDAAVDITVLEANSAIRVWNLMVVSSVPLPSALCPLSSTFYLLPSLCSPSYRFFLAHPLPPMRSGLRTDAAHFKVPCIQMQLSEMLLLLRCAGPASMQCPAYPTVAVQQ